MVWPPVVCPVLPTEVSEGEGEKEREKLAYMPTVERQGSFYRSSIGGQSRGR